MARFIWGLVIGGIGGGVTWAISDSGGIAALVGIVLACIIWFGLEIIALFT